MSAGSCNIEGFFSLLMQFIKMCFIYLFLSGLGQTDRWLVMLTNNGDVNVDWHLFSVTVITSTYVCSFHSFRSFLSAVMPSSFSATLQELILVAQNQWYSRRFLPSANPLSAIHLVLSISCPFKSFPVKEIRMKWSCLSACVFGSYDA